MPSKPYPLRSPFAVFQEGNIKGNQLSLRAITPPLPATVKEKCRKEMERKDPPVRRRAVPFPCHLSQPNFSPSSELVLFAELPPRQAPSEQAAEADGRTCECVCVCVYV